MQFVIVVFRLIWEWRLGMGFRVNLEAVIITFNHRFSEKYSLDLGRQQMLKTESLWLNLLYGLRQANLVLIAYASSEGSGEPAHPRSLTRTSAARSYKQWVKRNLQTESQIPSPSEWLGMHSYNLSWRNARRHRFAWLPIPVIARGALQFISKKNIFWFLETKDQGHR